MFYIDQSSTDLLIAKDEHYRNLRYIIKKKLQGNNFAENHPQGLTKRIRQVSGIHSNVYNFFKDENNLKDILIGTPDILNGYKGMFKTKKEKKGVRSLLNYIGFIDKRVDSTFGFYNAFDLARNLNIRTCVYCNRLYTDTVITERGEKIMRPTFDHWFPKEEFPLLSLSFYNLIPSCSICNTSIKGSQSNSLDQFFHPYLKHTNSDMRLDFNFSYLLNSMNSAQCRVISKNAFSEHSVKAMRLEEMYGSHGQEINDLILLKRAYSSSYMQSLNSILKVNLSSDEIYRLAFGTYIQEEELIKRPISKLKRDILIELGII